jgi:hypothetical protein
MADDWSVVSETPAPSTSWDVVGERPARAPSKPMGSFSSQVGSALSGESFKPVEVPTTKELGQEYTEVAKGVPSGALGTPGDIETLLRFGGRKLGADIDTRSILPTSERVATYLFDETPSDEKLAKSRQIGYLLGGLIGPGEIAKVLKGAGEFAIGSEGAVQSKFAKEFEKRGYQLEPGQVREKKRVASSGYGTKAENINRDLANTEVAKSTGTVPKDNKITPEFLEQRSKELGNKYDQIFKRDFDIDENFANQLDEIAKFERSVNGSGEIAAAANNLKNRYIAAKQEAEEQAILKIMKGQRTGLKRGVGELPPGFKYETKEFKPGEVIDAQPLTREWLEYYNSSNHRNVRPITDATAPEWSKDVNSVITELTNKLGLRVRPGVYVGEAKGSYGWASPHGHIFLNESALKNGTDALATALHEFGHMTEFQLLEQAPKDVKQAINDAWKDSLKEGKGKTVEQLRPISASKYGPEHKNMIPTTTSDKNYYLGFQEWFAEQVSRWLTTAKEPTTIADKFFKGIADAWKTIYSKVTGYLPMGDATDKFMRYNWGGKLINETTAKNLLTFSADTAQALRKSGVKDLPTSPIQLTDPVIAKISGPEIQALRSKISALSTQEGMVGHRAGELLKNIDSIIASTNPKIAEALADTNRKYQATKSLKDFNSFTKGEGLRGGNVDLSGLGEYLAYRGEGSSHPLYYLGRGGSELGITSKALGPETERINALNAVLGRGGRLLKSIVGTRSPVARQVQKRLLPPRKSGERRIYPKSSVAAILGQQIDENNE